MEVTTPQTDAEFTRYYDLRWQVLRAPWGEPMGSERDELDASADHAVVWGEDGSALAVGRLHFNSPAEAQIRYMAVTPQARGRGLGRAIVEHIETLACRQGAERIVLNSRDDATEFYARLGFEVVGAGPTMFGSVAHVRMIKRLVAD